MVIRPAEISKAILSTLTVAAIILAGVSVLPERKAMAAGDVTINTALEYQTIRGFGGIDHPEWTGSSLTAAQRQTAFGNGDNELGFTVLRIYVNDDRNQWNKALSSAKDVTERGGIVFASPWNPPASMAETFTRNGVPNQKRLRHDKYAEYAQHLNDFVHYMEDNGVDLYAISIQNEPDYAEDWTWWTSDECLDFLVNYADDIDCRIMSPETFQYNKDYYNKILNNSTAYANTDLFGTHFYGTSRNAMDFPALEKCGKEIWMTEVYVPNSDENSADRWPEAIQVSENMHNGLVVGNMNAYVWWYIRRQYGPMKENGNISKRGYCMAQYSKFVRPGYMRIGATEQPAENVFISAYKGGDNEVVIVAVNKGSAGYTQNFVISGGEDISGVDRYRTSASENLALTKNIEAGANSFFAQLPGESVSTFVVKLSSDPDENGHYFHDEFEDGVCGWTARGGTTLETSTTASYMGTNSLAVTERASAWNGAQKALGTGVFKPSEAYSFSACVMYSEGSPTEQFYLSLQYTDADGETQYAHIDSKIAVKGEWVQLYNRNYVIPVGASNVALYVETVDTTTDFLIDEAIGAVAGTVIDGPAEKAYIIGDINGDDFVNAADVLLGKRGLLTGFTDAMSKPAADADCSGSVDAEDIRLIGSFVLGSTTEFPTAD